VRMVTGDAKETATAIAVKIGLCTKEEASQEGTVWIGKDFSAAVYDEVTDTIDFEACSKIWPKLRVMGRCEPRDKYASLDPPSTASEWRQCSSFAVPALLQKRTNNLILQTHAHTDLPPPPHPPPPPPTPIQVQPRERAHSRR
jgi:hypothetical protein